MSRSSSISTTSGRRGVNSRRRGPAVAPLAPAALADDLVVEAVGLAVGVTVDERGQQVGLLALAVTDQVEVAQLDRPPLLEHQPRRAPHGGEPVGQLLGVRHGGRQAHERHRGRQVDDHLLPHRAAVGVLQVVDLVEHDEAQAVQRR